MPCIAYVGEHIFVNMWGGGCQNYCVKGRRVFARDPDILNQKPGDHPNFKKKRCRSEKAIVGALREFRGVLVAALGIRKAILGTPKSILGMASHDLSNTLTLQSLLFSISLLFSFSDFLAFSCVFPSFSKDFRGSAKRKTLACLGKNPCFFQKSKVWRVRVQNPQLGCQISRDDFWGFFDFLILIAFPKLAMNLVVPSLSLMCIFLPAFWPSSVQSLVLSACET